MSACTCMNNLIQESFAILISKISLCISSCAMNIKPKLITKLGILSSYFCLYFSFMFSFVVFCFFFSFDFFNMKPPGLIHSHHLVIVILVFIFQKISLTFSFSQNFAFLKALTQCGTHHQFSSEINTTTSCI